MDLVDEGFYEEVSGYFSVFEIFRCQACSRLVPYVNFPHRCSSPHADDEGIDDRMCLDNFVKWVRESQSNPRIVLNIIQYYYA